MKALIQIMLIQKYKDKIIHTKVFEVLTLFGQLYLHSHIRENHLTISYKILWRTKIIYNY